MGRRRSSTAFEMLQRRSSVQTPVIPRKLSLFGDAPKKQSFAEKHSKRKSSLTKKRGKGDEKVKLKKKISKLKIKKVEWLLFEVTNWLESLYVIHSRSSFVGNFLILYKYLHERYLNGRHDVGGIASIHLQKTWCLQYVSPEVAIFVLVGWIRRALKELLLWKFIFCPVFC